MLWVLWKFERLWIVVTEREGWRCRDGLEGGEDDWEKSW